MKLQKKSYPNYGQRTKIHAALSETLGITAAEVLAVKQPEAVMRGKKSPELR